MTDDTETSIPRAFGKGYDAGYRNALQTVENRLLERLVASVLDEHKYRDTITLVRELRRQHEDLTKEAP